MELSGDYFLIRFYHDGFGLKNPAGSSKDKHKTGMEQVKVLIYSNLVLTSLLFENRVKFLPAAQWHGHKEA